jgi:signal transduction histidine kinase
LDNAIRYSPEHSTITINIESKADRVECSVIDQGPGMPAEHLPFIFERFYRVNTARTRTEGGAGLGLAIAKALIHAQAGEIRAESLEGKGTTITFWLPVSKAAQDLPHL